MCFTMRNPLNYIVPIAVACLFFGCSSASSDGDKLSINEGTKISFSISSAQPEPASKSLSATEYVVSGFSLCKDNDYELSPMQISSNTHYGGNTYPSGGKVYERLDWVTGDIITIFSDNASTASGSKFADYKINDVKPSSTHKSTATIEAVAGNNSLLWGNASLTHRFVAVYPSSSSITSSMSESFIEGVKYGVSNSSARDAIIPPHQYAVRASATSMVYEPDMSYAYMGAAVSASDAGTVNLSFTPLFNAYEFRLVKDGEADMKLKRVVLHIKENGGKYLSGTKYLFTVSSNASDIASGKLTEAGLDDSYSGVVASNFSESVELSFKDQNGADITSGVSLSATEPLCFVMLSAPREITSADELTIELDMVIDGNAVKRSLKLNKNGQFLELPAAGKLTITNVSVPQTIDVPSKYTERAFSVSASDKVYFSPGNLQAMPNAPGSAAAWRFAPHQYEIIGSNFDYTNGFTSANKDYMDLFTWSIEPTFGTGVRWGLCTENNANVWNDFIDGAYVEWGTNPLLSTTLGSYWFTPTESHWRYVVTGRNNCANLRSLGTVCGVRGLILLPDDWVLPQGCTFSASASVYTANVYDASSWASMEEAGAVFLPIAGYRNNASVNVSMNANPHSYLYWSSTPEGANFLVRMLSTLSEHYTSSAQVTSMNVSDVRASAHPVRLVRFVPAPLPTDLSKQDIHGNPSAMNTANCYVVSQKGEYMLPCVYGNAIKEGTTNVNAYRSTISSNANVLTNFLDHAGAAIYTGNDSQDPWIESKYQISSASIVWQDNENMVTGVALRDVDVAGTQRKYVTFKVSDSPLKKGNAVIAVKNSSGTIMWSWHIWVTDQDLTPIDVLGQGGRTYYFMPVDLGWINVGDGYSPFYQWGRKDPQLPYNGSLASPADHAHYPAVWGIQNLGTNISSYIQNPHKFNSSATMDNKYLNLWSANNTLTVETDNPTIKTVYDPSPTGFCMPPSNAWINTVTTYSTINASAWDNGWYFYNGINGGDKTIFYRASGYRNIGNGNLVAIGSWAYYPSATPSNISTIFDLCFSETNINTAYSTDAKGYGLPVRPVKDSFDWSDSGAADAESGTLTVGCYPTQFSLSGGSGNLKIVCCRTNMTNSGGLYSFTYHNTASWILSFSSDGSNYTQTPPSWIHFDATSGVGGSMNISGSYSAGQALLDAINAGSNFNNIGFTVDALSSGSRTVYVLVSQPVSLNTTVVRITQQSGAEGGTTELNYNIGYGNVIRYSSPNIAIGGGWGHGFGNVALGNYNYIAGSGNKAIGKNCTAIGRDNIAGGWSY